jgi:hypothetical protein
MHPTHTPPDSEAMSPRHEPRGWLRGVLAALVGCLWIASLPARARPWPSPVVWEPIWILAAPHFAAVTRSAVVRRLFARGTVLEPVGPRERPSRRLPVLPTAVFHNERLFARTVDALASRGIRAVLYDNERFATTPPREQQDPRLYDTRFAALARRRGLLSVCDLILPDRLPPGERTPRAEVPPCAVVGLNTVQQSERDPRRYIQRVRRLVAIVRRLRPHVPIVAGISSNPRGPRVSPRTLARDMRLASPYVQGFWLNVPAPGVGCPRCRRPRPAVLARALTLAAHGLRFVFNRSATLTQNQP